MKKRFGVCVLVLLVSLAAVPVLAQEGNPFSVALEPVEAQLNTYITWAITAVFSVSAVLLASIAGWVVATFALKRLKSALGF